MPRSGRVLFCGFAAGLVAVVLTGLRLSASQSTAENETAKLESEPQPAARRDATTTGTADSDIARFVSLLDRLRGDDEEVLPEMRELADRLCTVHDRCDGREILEYYAALPAASRTKGRSESAEVDAAWNRVSRRISDPSWDPSADEDVARLRKLSTKVTGDADVCPAATAACLLAHVDLLRPSMGANPGESERSDWVEATADEAQRAIAGFTRCGMRVRTLQPMWILGRLELEAGREREAEGKLRDCLALARKLHNAEWRERSLDDLIQIAKSAGDLGQVAELIDELASFRTPDTSWLLVREKAILLLQQDFAATVSEFLEEHKPPEPNALREWHLLQGSALTRRGDLSAARDSFASAEPPPWSKDVRMGMALVDLRAGNAERTIEQLSRHEFLEEEDPLARAFLQEIRGEALIRLNRFGDARRCLDEGLSIGGRIQTHLAAERNLVGSATSVIGESVGVHAVALLAEAQIRSDAAMEAARSIEAWQSRTLRQATGASEDLTTEDLLAWARFTGGGLVTWVVGPDSTAVVFVSPDGTAQGATIPRGRRAIDAAVRRLCAAIRADDLPLADRIGSEVLAGILPEPVGRHVRERREVGDRTLFLLHGPLERLPVEFLFRNDRTAPLVLPGLPEAKPGTAITPEQLTHWNVLGHPVDTEGRARLPGAREELSQVAVMRGARPVDADSSEVLAAETPASGVRMCIGAAFDRQHLLEALARPEPLHLATHLVSNCGEGTGRMGGVGLELSDGSNICAREILDAHPKLPLAVLSACETAEGRFVDAEGLQGVARAFLESGTRNLLVTLWPVEDNAARDFAAAFHRALIAGELPAEAAASARATLIRNHRPSADWAAFRMIGRD